MNIITVLKKDHKEVNDMLQSLEKESNKAEKIKLELFKELDLSLHIHTQFEENFFYPTLKDNIKDLICEAYEEHHIVKIILKELMKMSSIDDIWQAKLTVLKENVQHHIKEEENEIFPIAKKVLPEDQLRSLAEKYLMLKERALKKAA